MSGPIYDFRDGILLEKVVYKDDSCNFGYVLLYIGCLLIEWAIGCGFFALFFYSYIEHEKPTYITFIVIWCIFICIVIVIGFLTIQRSKNEKIRKIKEKEDRERQLREINDAKRRRNENMRNNINNFDDINTNIGPITENNFYESERRKVMETNDFVNEEDNKY